MKRCFCLVILLFSLLCAGCATREAPYLEPLPEEEQATFITSDLHGDFRYSLPEGSAESFSVYAELWEDGALVRTLPLATLGEATGEAVPMSLDIIFSENAGEIYCGVDCSQSGRMTKCRDASPRAKGQGKIAHPAPRAERQGNISCHSERSRGIPD